MANIDDIKHALERLSADELRQVVDHGRALLSLAGPALVRTADRERGTDFRRMTSESLVDSMRAAGYDCPDAPALRRSPYWRNATLAIDRMATLHRWAELPRAHVQQWLLIMLPKLVERVAQGDMHVVREKDGTVTYHTYSLDVTGHNVLRRMGRLIAVAERCFPGYSSPAVLCTMLNRDDGRQGADDGSQ